MWQVDKKFEDPINPRGKSYLCLNADKPMSPSHITYPILWDGFLNDERITVKQKGSSSFHERDYEFIEYPEGHEYLKQRIIEAINQYLRILD